MQLLHLLYYIGAMLWKLGQRLTNAVYITSTENKIFGMLMIKIRIFEIRSPADANDQPISYAKAKQVAP